MKKIVHIVGTGTIGEPLIGLFTDFRSRMGIDEVTFHKRTPLQSDRAKLEHLMARGARLAVDPEVRDDFEKLGHTVTYDSDEALEQATVVIDCTPAGNENKELYYAKLAGPRGFLAQGSEFGFGKPYARGINEEALDPEEDRFLEIVSCNTHSITNILKTLCDESWDGPEKAAGAATSGYDLDRAVFVCMRRSNDITQVAGYVPSPQVGGHRDGDFGTHHARDAHSVFHTLGLDLDLFSSAVKLNTQYMHSLWFHLTLDRDVTREELLARFRSNARVAMTAKKEANLIFSFGRDHGYYGRILSQVVVVEPTLAVRGGRDVFGFAFTPQDGNSLLSSIAAALWRIEPDWESVSERLQVLRRFIYQEI
jgi:glyceraldehyde-3-phosphate dehydrogenase (NAD(P))